jgi:predicted Zn-dependent protease
MHPSIAMLPSQEDAALAFAQVVTFLERFRERFGDAGLTRAIQLLASGQDVRLALARVASEGFPELETQWRSQLTERARPEPPVAGPAAKELKLRFVENGAADESLDVSEGRARKHLRVGDLLWGKHRILAAAREYESAQKLSPADPILASRVARAALAGDAAQRALAALDSALLEHPTHEPLQALRGTALLALSRAAEARAPLLEAIRLNPFDPAPHCQLSRIPEAGDDQARELRACKLLSPP